jgi:hypothetical protein
MSGRRRQQRRKPQEHECSPPRLEDEGEADALPQLDERALYDSCAAALSDALACRGDALAAECLRESLLAELLDGVPARRVQDVRACAANAAG